MDEVLCDVVPPEVHDVLLGQPYLWKNNVAYESRPFTVIITLWNKLYMIPELALPTTIPLIFAKKCSKINSQTKKLIFFLIHSKSKVNIMATSMAPEKGSST